MRISRLLSCLSLISLCATACQPAATPPTSTARPAPLTATPPPTLASIAAATPTAAPTATLSPTDTPAPTATTPPEPTLDPRMPFTGTLLIADAGNNRLLEVTADKRIVWAFPEKGSLPPGRPFHYPDDAFFSPDYKYVLINEEDDHIISVVEYATKKLVWDFGVYGVPGNDLKHLNEPDDTQMLPDGRIVVADIKNCRILIISWDKRTVKTIGTHQNCSGEPGTFASPNGIEPLPNGHFLITEIRAQRASEIDEQGHVLRSVKLPFRYPSDAFITPRDTIVVASYTTGGHAIEINWAGQVLWSWPPEGSAETLDRSSIADELPNGNIVIADDHHHRVIIVNRAGEILWQYGVTGVPGNKPGYLNTPDGFNWHPPAAP